MPVAPIKHNCKPHPFQDERYKGKRVFSETAKQTLRCSVCGNEQAK